MCYRKVDLKAGWGIRVGTAYMALSYGIVALFNLGFQMFAVRLLEPGPYGSVSVLYSSVVLLSLLMGQTFELTLSRHVSEYVARGQDCALLIKRCLLWQGVTFVCIVIISMLLQRAITDRLFPNVPMFFYILVTTAICYSFEVGSRGVLRGLREFGYYGTLNVTLNLSRVVYLLLLVGVLDLGLVGAGLSVLFAAITNILLIPLWYRRVRDRLKGHSETDPMTMLPLLRFIIPTMAMFGCGAYFYNIGPVYIRLLGGESSDELAGLFLIATMISRLPLQASEALSTNLLPNMSRLSAKGDWQSIKHYIARSYQLFVPLLVVAIAGIYLFGNSVIRLFYPDYSYTPLGLTMLTIATGFVVLTAANNQFLLAQSKVSEVIVGWLTGCVVFTAIVLMAPWNILFRLELGYLLAGLAIWTCTTGFTYRSLSEAQTDVQSQESL